MSILNNFENTLSKLEKLHNLKGKLIYNTKKGLWYYNLDIPIKLKISNIMNDLELIKRLEKAYG